MVPVGFKEAELALKGIKDGYPKAATDAINRSLISGRAAAAQEISHRYAISSTNVKNAGFTLKNATWSHLEGSMEISSHMLPLGSFTINVRMVKGSFGPKRQLVSATVIRGQKKVVKGAFVVNGRVMERRQPERHPIFPVSTISVAHMAGEKEVSKAIQEAMQTQVATRLKHNVDYALGRLQEQSNKVRMKVKAKVEAKDLK